MKNLKLLKQEQVRRATQVRLQINKTVLEEVNFLESCGFWFRIWLWIRFWHLLWFSHNQTLSQSHISCYFICSHLNTTRRVCSAVFSGTIHTHTHTLYMSGIHRFTFVVSRTPTQSCWHSLSVTLTLTCKNTRHCVITPKLFQIKFTMNKTYKCHKIEWCLK